MGAVNTDVSLSASQENEKADTYWEWEHTFSAENFYKNIEGRIFIFKREEGHSQPCVKDSKWSFQSKIGDTELMFGNFVKYWTMSLSV